MDRIADNIEQLRELGIGLGLDDKEIDAALSNSLIRETPVSPNDEDVHAEATNVIPEKTKKVTLCRCVKWMMISVFVIYFVLCLFCVTSVYLATDEGAQTSVSYQIARIIRFMVLPIVQFVDLSEYHEMTCLLPNPFYSPPPIHCEPCRRVMTIPWVKNIDSDVFKKEYADLSRPVDEHTFTNFSNLQEMYVNNEKKFSKGGFKLGSNCADIASLSSFMGQYSDEALRTGSRSPNLLYIQASGSRRLFLIPRGNCSPKCESLGTVLSAGHALYIPDRFWRVDSIVSPNATDELSISFVTNFS
ncbi:hypothetical protein CAPTEDRAFT_186663 [Capitella teleta]|uniref:Cupin-like domain-containing protein n=1 Tax=Capitella teleta TaxID=283909 RepID=R7TQK2_CAPTE|nr:hypothetical protein CAPTEDRAFT_186663 [Capitella teleta]|eukprot:ELT95944.1 hypothetical protein CAPTEDRAFT_186663 [Capitella teleta]